MLPVLAGLLVLGTSVGTAARTSPAPSFAEARSFRIANAPYWVAIGDLNGDDRLDLATANRRSDTISVLLNKGDGSFEEVADRAGAQSTRWTLAVAAADFNHDGWPDLYLANDYDPEELFLNRDDGQGGRRFELAHGTGLDGDSKSGMCVALGDVLNEGRLAVYVTNISKSGYIFQGNNFR